MRLGSVVAHVARRPAATFAVAATGAFVVLLVLGRHLWFFGDEWAFIVTRRRQFADGQYVDYLFQPHNEHWSTIHVLAHALLFKLFGVRSYLPYLSLALLAHLYVVVMMRALLQRVQLTAWQSNVGAGTLLLLGTGAESLAYGFQFGFTIACAFGLTQLVLADHDETLGRRDALGVVIAILGLASSNTVVPVIVATGAMLAIRKRWRAAALHVGAPLAVYLCWYAKFGVRAAGERHIDQIPPYTYRGVTAAVEGLTQWRGAGGVIVLVVVGVAATMGMDELRRTAVAWGCAVGAVAMFALTAIDRASLGIEQSVSSRYSYIGAVLLLPSIALTLQYIVRRLQLGPILAVAVVSWAVVAGVAQLLQFERERRVLVDDERHAMQAAVAVSRVPGVDLGASPDPVYAAVATIDALAGLVDSGDLRPEPVPPDALLRAQALFLLRFSGDAGATSSGSARLESSDRAVVVASSDGCVTVTPAGGVPRLVVHVVDRATLVLTTTSSGDVVVTLATTKDGPFAEPRTVSLRPGQPLAASVELTASPIFDLTPTEPTTICGLTVDGS